MRSCLSILSNFISQGESKHTLGLTLSPRLRFMISPKTAACRLLHSWGSTFTTKYFIYVRVMMIISCKHRGKTHIFQSEGYTTGSKHLQATLSVKRPWLCSFAHKLFSPLLSIHKSFKA